jgi:hypothetical protein
VSAFGADVSLKPANQQLVRLEPDGGRLRATFYAPGTLARVARTVAAAGPDAVVAVDAPSGPRLDLLGSGSPARAALGLPDGRYETMRVCDAQLFRRGLPLYPVPPQGETPTGWQGWMGVGFSLFAQLAELGLPLYRPPAPGGALSDPVGPEATAHGRACEAFPDAIFCVLLGYRPAPKRTPSGIRDRIEALGRAGVVDADGDLWRRSLDELDACAAALAAHGLAAGAATWLGAPAEGVVVLPGDGPLDGYPKRPPLERAALEG